MKIIKLIFFPVIVFLIIGGTFISCKNKGTSSNTIKIGVPGAHSGDLASYGLPTVKAVQFVVDEANAKGGILGKKIELVIEDDVCKPEIATNIATKLVTSGVNAVIGHICSGATKAAIGIYKDSKLVCISPSATNTDLTLSGNYPNFFRTIAHDDSQAQLQVSYAINSLKFTKIAIIHDKGDYGKGNAMLAKKHVENSGKAKVVLFEGVTPGAVDYSAIVHKIKRSNAEVVIWGGYHPEASKVVRLMRQKKMETKFIGADGLKDITFIQTAGKFAEGVYVSGPKDYSKNRMAIVAKEAHIKKYKKEHGAFYLEAYAAAKALLNAIKKAGSTDYNAIIKALQSEYVETPLGKISFDKNGDPIGVGFAMYRVKAGKFVEIK